MDSVDGWCYVDTHGRSVWPSNFDAEEPEVELEPMVVEQVVKSKVVLPRESKNRAEVDVLDLLKDNATTSTLYSREIYLAMLAPVHQRRILMGAKVDVKPASRKRPVREAFSAPSGRLYENVSFVDRLRASVPSRRSRPEPYAIDETPVGPFTKDQGTQTDAPILATPPDRLPTLSSALERSLNLSVQLKTKSGDLERLDVRAIHLQSKLDRSLRDNQQLSKQLRTAERGLQISRKRSGLAEEYQDHLKNEIEQLRGDNDALQERLEVLTGGIDVDVKSIDELEHLEDVLDRAMAKIRGSLRSKYRAASGMEAKKSTSAESSPRKNSDEFCVVCMAQLKCVRLEPCGHEVLCSECALRVTSCPVDRRPIQDKVLTHGINAYTIDK